MNGKKFLLVCMVTLFFLTSVYYAPVNALTYDYYTLENYTSEEGGLSNRFAELSNGKLVYAQVENSDTHIGVYVINSDNSQYGHIDINVGQIVYAVGVSYVSDTEILITYFYCYYSSGAKLNYYVVLFNPITLAYETDFYNGLMFGAGSVEVNSPKIVRFSKFYYYSSYYYQIMYFNWCDTSTTPDTQLSFIIIVKYALHGTPTCIKEEGFSELSGTTVKYTIDIEMCDDLLDSGYLYFLCGDEQRGYGFYIFTLGASPTVDALAFYGTEADFPHADGPPVTYNTKANFQHLNSGVLVSNSTVYLYFAWTVSYGIAGPTYYENAFKFVQNRLLFNGSIAAANLLSQDRVASTASLSSNGLAAWLCGYSYSNDEYIIYVEDSEALYNDEGIYIGTDYKASKITVNISDWFTTADVALTIEDDRNFFLIIDDLATSVGDLSWDMMSRFGVVDNGVNAIWIFTNLDPMSIWFDVELTYTPTDDPLYTNKAYTYTATIYKNGVVANGIYFTITINDIFYNGYISGVGGVKTIPQTITFTSTGENVVTIKVYYSSYDLAEYDYQESFMYLTINGEQDPDYNPDIWLNPTTVTNLINYGAIFIVVLGPAFMLSVIGPSGSIG